MSFGADGITTASPRQSIVKKSPSSTRNWPNAIRATQRLLVWHISNEYGGDCHCPLCQDAFRNWLRVRYNGDLDALNLAWWSGFWSHTFTAWDQIGSPRPYGDRSVMHGQSIDWMRFVTAQTIDFYQHEIVPLKRLTPDIPCTTNLWASTRAWTTGSWHRYWMW